MHSSNLTALNVFGRRTRLSNRERGQGLVEYAMLLVLVAIVLVGIVGILGGTIENVLYRNGVCHLGNTFAQGDTITECE